MTNCSCRGSASSTSQKTTWLLQDARGRQLCELAQQCRRCCCNAGCCRCTLGCSALQRLSALHGMDLSVL
jgi:hypothetical protein